MPHFGAVSKVRLATCHPDLRRLFEAVVAQVDCTVITGHRGEQAQEAEFIAGNSQKHWPDGEHNKLPSTAIDVIPVVPAGFDVWDVKDLTMQLYWWRLTYCIMRCAQNLGIKVRWGLDWNGDGNTADTKLKDWPHWELLQ